MFKEIKKIVAFLFGGALSLTIVAQPADSIGWRDFSYIKQSEAWLGSENAAGLGKLQVERVSMAEAYFKKQHGAFCNYAQSEESYRWGAGTESFYRLNPRVVFYGKAGYDNFTGKDMGGSVFINPENTPFDIVEYAENTRGEKNLENYHLVGAVSGALGNGWTLGAKVDFLAANYAKDRDLRHQNKLLDMYVTAGAMYRLSSRMEAGANYYYRRSTEGVDFDTYGTTDKTYTSLISFGAFFGQTEVFGGNGYTKGNEEKPLFDEYHGGALQLNWQWTPHLSWYHELAYKSRKGYYGKKSPYTVVYSRHEADVWDYNTTLFLKKGVNLHQLHFGGHYEGLDNFENIYRSENEAGGSSDIVYYGMLHTADKTTWNARAEYIGNLGVTGYCPAWVLKGGAAYRVRNVKASIYPYYRGQHLRMADVYLSAERNLIRPKHVYNLLLGIAYCSGNGEVKEDGAYAAPSESRQSPSSMDAYLYKEYEYLTARQVKGEIGLKYAWALEKQPVRCHVSLHYTLQKAFRVDYLGNGLRQEVSLAVGCTF